MAINHLRGFRRLGWVVAGLCLPVVVFVGHQESQEFAGFDKQRVSSITVTDEAGKTMKLSDRLSPDEVVELLVAERNGTIELKKRDALDELRRRNQWPYVWELEIRKTNWGKFAAAVLLAEAAIIILIQGSIIVLAWILRGFNKEGY